MFHPFETFSLGPFTISIQLLFLIIGIFLSYVFFVTYLKKADKGNYKEVENHVFVSLIIAIGIYKLWPFILQPSLLTSPSNLLYFMGGPYALQVSVGVSLLYFFIQSLRKKWSYQTFDSLAFGVVISLFVLSFFVREYGQVTPFSLGFKLDGEVYHPINIYKSWSYLILIISCLLLISKEKRFARTIFLFIGILFITYLLAPFS
ncbi:hypothetical protein ACERII_11780 [Evansella sp. AB-rgal1]|uniref:hypothetical protein n=1 Tax=Evansella sp. AB-rgal1 TaxID=3242696 RepID=UPI00359D0A25